MRQNSNLTGAFTVRKHDSSLTYNGVGVCQLRCETPEQIALAFNDEHMASVDITRDQLEAAKNSANSGATGREIFRI